MGAPLTKDEVNQYAAQFHQTQGQRQAATLHNSQQPNFGSGFGGFVKRNLPTIGGIVGGTITAPLELLDAVSGVGGTALNVAGAAGGAALGQKLQNHLTGTKNSTLGAAVSGGAGELGGRFVGGTLGKIGSKVTGKVDSSVAKAADNKAVIQNAKELEPFANIAKGEDLEGAINTMKTLGMDATPGAMKTAAGLTTGKNGELNNALRQVLGGNGGNPIKVDVGDYLNHVGGAIDSEPMLGYSGAKTGSGSKLLQSITKNKENNLFDNNGSLTQQADGNKVLDAIQYHQKQAARYGKSVPGTEGEAVANVHKQAAEYLNNQLGKHAGADKAVAGYKLSPDDAQSILERVKGEGGSPQLAQHIVDTINNSKSVGELRNAQAPFVHASQLADKAEKFAQGQGFVNEATQAAKEGSKTAGGSLMRHPFVALSALHGNPAGLAYLAADSAEENAGKVAGAAGKLVNGGRALNDTPQNIISRLSGDRIPNGAELRDVGQQATSATATKLVGRGIAQEGAQSIINPSEKDQRVDLNSIVAPYEEQAAKDSAVQQGQTIGGDNQGGASSADGNNIDAGGISKTQLVGLIASDPKNASTYISLFNALKPSQTGTAAQAKSVAAAKNASNTLGQIESDFNATGGGKGKVSGTVENIIGKLGGNSNVATYNDTATALAASLYKALGNTGTISDRDQAMIAKLIPRTTDTKTTAQAKISQLRSLLEQAQETATAGIGQ